MAPKRPLEDDAPAFKHKKQRSGFNVGPDNLPDGTWKRKVVKIKNELIHKAKVKKSYAKIKAREPEAPLPSYVTSPSPPPEPVTEPSQELHPERQAMLDAPREPTPPPQSHQQYSRPPRERKNRRPGYFEKEEAYAEQQKAEAHARRDEFERRDKERKGKIEEREQFRKAMAKARSGGRNGQRKLGRESQVLLERVRRMVGE